jgi:hypothetical protein
MFCQVIIETIRVGRIQVIRTKRACKNYARKGMTCCYSHRKLENMECVQKTENEWPEITLAHEIISKYEEPIAAHAFIDVFTKWLDYKDIYQNRLALLLSYEFFLKFQEFEFKEKKRFLEVITRRLLETPDHIQEHYQPKLAKLS